MKDINFVVNEGKINWFLSFSLFCFSLVLGFNLGKPLPVIHWYRDSIPIISETYETNGAQSVKSDITIGPLGRQDLNMRLSCKAINHPRASPLETTVQIDMNCKYFHKICLLFDHNGKKHNFIFGQAGVFSGRSEIVPMKADSTVLDTKCQHK